MLLYFWFRWANVSLHPGNVLNGYVASGVTVASIVIAFTLPRLIFRDATLPDVGITTIVAVAIAFIATAALAKFYRGSPPESPEDLY